jgi:hypothetical protein
MEATEIIQYLRKQDFTLEADGQYLALGPAEKVTDQLIQRLRQYKPTIIVELKREERQHFVLSMLVENPTAQIAMITHLEAVPEHVILTIAIRAQCTLEMLIPRIKYYPFLLLDLINAKVGRALTFMPDELITE